MSSIVVRYDSLLLHLNNSLHLRGSANVSPVMNNDELARLAMKFLKSLL